MAEEWEVDFQNIQGKHKVLMSKHMLRREVAKQLKEEIETLDPQLDELIRKATLLKDILSEVRTLRDAEESTQQARDKAWRETLPPNLRDI